MWPFKKPSKSGLNSLHKVRVNGWIFVIRKVNPLLDFKTSEMPQIFTDFISRRKREEPGSPEALRKAQQDMYAVIEAGLVEPKLVPIGRDEKRGQEDGITVEDLFRDGDTGPKLYLEIIAHSLNRFRGLRGSFFLAKKRFQLYTAWRRSTDSDQVTSPSLQESSV